MQDVLEKLKGKNIAVIRISSNTSETQKKFDGMHTAIRPHILSSFTSAHGPTAHHTDTYHSSAHFAITYPGKGVMKQEQGKMYQISRIIAEMVGHAHEEA